MKDTLAALEEVKFKWELSLPLEWSFTVMQLDGAAGCVCCRDCVGQGGTSMTKSKGAWRWTKEYVGWNSGFIF